MFSISNETLFALLVSIAIIFLFQFVVRWTKKRGRDKTRKNTLGYKKAKRQRIAIENDLDLYREIMVMIGTNKLPKHRTQEYDDLYNRCVKTDREHQRAVDKYRLSLTRLLETVTDETRGRRENPDNVKK